MRKSLVRKNIKRYLTLKTKIAQLQQELKEVSSVLIQEALNNDGLIELDGHKVQFTTFLKTSFNMSEFKKRCKKTYQKFIESVAANKLTVK